MLNLKRMSRRFDSASNSELLRREQDRRSHTRIELCHTEASGRQHTHKFHGPHTVVEAVICKATERACNLVQVEVVRLLQIHFVLRAVRELAHRIAVANGHAVLVEKPPA